MGCQRQSLSGAASPSVMDHCWLLHQIGVFWFCVWCVGWFTSCFASSHGKATRLRQRIPVHETICSRFPVLLGAGTRSKNRGVLTPGAAQTKPAKGLGFSWPFPVGLGFSWPFPEPSGREPRGQARDAPETHRNTTWPMLPLELIAARLFSLDPGGEKSPFCLPACHPASQPALASSPSPRRRCQPPGKAAGLMAQAAFFAGEPIFIPSFHCSCSPTCAEGQEGTGGV